MTSTILNRSISIKKTQKKTSVIGGISFCLGRNTGVEPVHDRFTAGCVHRFTNCATLEYYIVRQLVSQKKNLLLSLCVPIRHY